jgi:hypothetical protein
MLTVAILSILAGVALSSRFGALILLPVSLLATIGMLLFALTFHLSMSSSFTAVAVAIFSVNIGYFFGVFQHALFRSLVRRRHILRGSWSHR